MPTSMAARASSRVMAGPLAMLRVPGPILRLTRSGRAASGTATPKSATTPAAPSGATMRSRSFGRTFTGRLRRWEVLDDHGQAGDHVTDSVRGGGDALVDAPERVPEAQAHLRGRMHAGADLVGHDDEREAPLGKEVREPVGRGQDALLFVTPQEEVGDPERQAVEDHHVPPARQALAGRHYVVGHLERAPALGALGAVARDPRFHVAVEGLGRGEEGAARAPA